MQVKDIMKRPADVSLADAARMMDDLVYDSLPIRALDAERLEGVAFDRDIVTHCISQESDPYALIAGEAGMLYCFSSDDVGVVNLDDVLGQGCAAATTTGEGERI